MNKTNFKVDLNKKIGIIDQLKESKFAGSFDKLSSNILETLNIPFELTILVFENIKNKVPLENRIMPNAKTLKEVLENIAFIDDKILQEMFLNLLASSCDSTKNNLVHPSFSFILTQLCPEEAVIINLLKEKTSFKSNYFIEHPNYDNNRVINRLLSSELENRLSKEIENINNLPFFEYHLYSLGLVAYIDTPQITIYDDQNRHTGHTYEKHISLSYIGIQFSKACIP